MQLVHDAECWIFMLDWKASWNWIKEAYNGLLAATQDEACLSTVAATNVVQCVAHRHCDITDEFGHINKGIPWLLFSLKISLNQRLKADLRRGKLTLLVNDMELDSQLLAVESRQDIEFTCKFALVE